MARVLIAGCGCRGRDLAAALAARGHAVRGTSRSSAGRPAPAVAARPLVDTPVRGLVYEAAGTVEPHLLELGSAIVRAAAATYRMPVGIVDAGPDEHAAWVAAMAAAVAAVLDE